MLAAIVGDKAASHFYKQWDERMLRNLRLNFEYNIASIRSGYWFFYRKEISQNRLAAMYSAVDFLLRESRPRRLPRIDRNLTEQLIAANISHDLKKMSEVLQIVHDVQEINKAEAQRLLLPAFNEKGAEGVAEMLAKSRFNAGVTDNQFLLILLNREPEETLETIRRDIYFIQQTLQLNIPESVKVGLEAFKAMDKLNTGIESLWSNKGVVSKQSEAATLDEPLKFQSELSDELRNR